MKLVIFSDCHLEFHQDDGNSFMDCLPASFDDVAVVAGDLATLQMLDRAFATLCSKFKHVVFVNGNHELYGWSPSDIDVCRQRAKKFQNLSWLEREAVEIDGRRFVGTTLWFPEPPESCPKWALNDYNQIRGFEPWVYDQHEKSLEFLKTELRSTDILVTHHFPFKKSIPRAYEGSSLNAFFHAGERAEALVAEKKPVLAIHGHTHTSFDYVTDGVRVVCNPHGYPNENRGFDFGKIIILEAKDDEGCHE